MEGAEQEEEVANETWTVLDVSGIGLLHASPTLWSYSHLTTLLLCRNRLTVLPPGIAALKCLVKLDLSNNFLRQLPDDVGDLRGLRELLLAHNTLTTLPYSLGKLIGLARLDVFNNPLNPLLLSKLSQGLPTFLAFLLDNMPAPPHPPSRPWLSVSETETREEKLVVVCYNILFEAYATKQQFPYCPTWAIAWNRRREMIKAEVLSYDPDIVCLQEVGTRHYEDFFEPQMARAGYQGLYGAKTRSQTMTKEEAAQVDGCAIFFKKSRFTLLEQEMVDFRALALAWQPPTEDTLNRVMPKDNIAVLCALQPANHSTPILVANTHLYWDPLFKDVKVIQSAMLLQALAGCQERLRAQLACDSLPMIVCGDFNSLPDSGVVQLMSEGYVPKNHPDLLGLDYGDMATCCLSHPFRLASCYGGELPFTNHSYTFTGVLDYVWHTADSLQCVAVLGPVSEAYIQDCLGLPTPHYPSDHLPLVCELQFAATPRHRPGH